MEDGQESEGWTVSRRFAQQLTPVPSSVTQAIKHLWRDELRHLRGESDEISSLSYRSVTRVDRSAVLKMPIYFAAQALKPERFADMREDDAGKALVDLLGPGLFAALLSLIYCHRRINKLCAANNIWEELSKEYVLNMELGYLVGSCVPEIGEATGMLMGGTRIAALSTLLIKEPDQFMRYRNSNKKKTDLVVERERFRCDHTQIGGFVLKLLGFEIESVLAGEALRGRDFANEHEISGEYHRLLAAACLIDDVKRNNPLSKADLSHTGITLPDDARSKIQSKIENLFQSGSTFDWMFRGSKT